MSLTFKTSVYVVTLGLLASCSTLPASGPYGGEIKKQATASNVSKDDKDKKAKALPYALIEISSAIVPELKRQAEKSKSAAEWPTVGKPEEIKVSVGDTISITIFEAQSGGLFIPTEADSRPGNFVTLPQQTVDRSGQITVPYVGLVQAAGRTPNEMSETIKLGLQERAIEPQVIVTIVQRNSSEVSVIGRVNTARKIVLGYNGDRILDAIAQAGGPDVPGHEALVSLQREGNQFDIPFDELVTQPSKNIFLKPHDTVYLHREAHEFMMYGASEIKGNIAFEKRQITLSEAMAKAGGLRDSQADPSEVYIYRTEDIGMIKKFGVKLDDTVLAAARGNEIPVIYRLNLRDPDGFFLSQKFPMHNQDIVYIANAESVEFTKFLDILNSSAVTTGNTDGNILR